MTPLHLGVQSEAGWGFQNVQGYCSAGRARSPGDVLQARLAAPHMWLFPDMLGNV